MRPAAVFGVLAAASLTAGLAVPHLIAVVKNAPDGGSGLVDAHPTLVKWVVFVLVLGSLAAGLPDTLELLAGSSPARSQWLIASLYVADRANETPMAFPLRMPSSTVVRLAHYNPTGPNRIRWVNWDCAENV
jgi:hypothetical protein